MHLRKYLLASALVFSLTSVMTGCSLFSSEEDTIIASPSPEVTNQLQITQLWSSSLSSAGNTSIYSQLSPTQSDNSVIYAASRGGQVKAMDINSGKALWTTNLAKSSLFSSQSSLLSGGLSVDANNVYVGSERAVVYALNKDTGALVWQHDVNGEVLATPVSAEGKVIVHTSNGYLQALNASDGEEVWSINMGTVILSLRGESTPTIAHGAVLLGDNSGHVSAYLINDGQLIWQQRISQPTGSTEIARLNDVNTTPIVENGVVYAVGYNGNIVALDLGNGQVIWRKPLSSIHNLATDDGHVFAIDQNDEIIALSKNGGSLLWQQSDLRHRQLTNPVTIQNYLIVGDFEGYLYWLDASSGKIIAKIEVNKSGLLATPLVIGNRVVIQAKNGDVYAYSQH